MWGLFMDRYIFRGADASLPINWVTSQVLSNSTRTHKKKRIPLMSLANSNSANLRTLKLRTSRRLALTTRRPFTSGTKTGFRTKTLFSRTPAAKLSAPTKSFLPGTFSSSSFQAIFSFILLFEKKNVRSTRIARIGGSTCFQIVLHKNLNNFDRFGLSAMRHPPKGAEW